jgi:hypothetical protein
MPSLTHDALLQLCRNRPTLAPELLRDALHAHVPAFDHVRIGDVTLTEVVPTEYRADLVLLLEGADGTTPAAALVVEAQLGRDPDKRWSWPVYLTNLRARLRCDVALMVVTSDAAVAGWAGTPIATGHPGWVLVPLVLGPQAVPVVRDAAVAERSPELAVLSVMLHGRGGDALAVAEAALAGARGLDDERSKLYADLVFASVDEARVLFWRHSWRAGTTSIRVTLRGATWRRARPRAVPRVGLTRCSRCSRHAGSTCRRTCAPASRRAPSSSGSTRGSLAP